ncbi:4Fe-4S dicluster domain-containing protein [Neorhizobium galegae]|uniref:Ferredoxin-like protein in nif region n=1 Tax=Neorhizobium galegae bv. orientalis str. HAMBI 540 TaxID=1028800 RepID=A0A068SZY5_NEOGA|nr:4Fe-4S dicluster domain-containing protein [Neorhizobium galegae]KAB1119309.1 4Fe-4S dicluster domain-containing protein [Neorhizobium galegae]MCQ1575125.1 4Fe-4S dicluster domain-containing protein [Neorhizobium galegae]MCQ1810866.1 4Fe-4S dicluster domain-containing protein [Neorhizobium galegae]MCQ1838066.1 4Fe-4S dicluster domain-containing protein [Neorhizobium galegae]MCQ1855676.1 4Fe-4S dicluster domain-containing protein [Neorhizobium galegae]
MAFKIVTSQCSQCGACEFVCPSGAVALKGENYVIDPRKCTECDEFGTQQCAAACPMKETCVPA